MAYDDISQDELDEKVHDLCCELAVEEMNQIEDEDEQESILATWESKASNINNQGSIAQIEFLTSH